MRRRSSDYSTKTVADDMLKSIKNKLAWKVVPYHFIQGDRKYQKRKSMGVGEIEKEMKSMISKR